MENATTPEEKQKAQAILDRKTESNVAKYGMITVRTDGKRIIIAQKLEVARKDDQKWDIYELTYDPDVKGIVYGGH